MLVWSVKRIMCCVGFGVLEYGEFIICDVWFNFLFFLCVDRDGVVVSVFFVIYKFYKVKIYIKVFYNINIKVNI